VENCSSTRWSSLTTTAQSPPLVPQLPQGYRRGAHPSRSLPFHLSSGLIDVHTHNGYAGLGVSVTGARNANKTMRAGFTTPFVLKSGAVIRNHSAAK
jgi:hypothetical protein